MKNKVIFLAVILLCYNLNVYVYGISNEFKFVIDTIGIPQYNVYNQEINEDVYYTYNVFCYSSPKEASQNAAQGFKSVIGGKWTQGDSKYVGVGDSGEYYYIGRQYNGSLVSNVRYPVSFFPETTPNYWNYLVVDGALNSWNDKSKYKYSEQLEYMKNTFMLFDRLDFVNKVTNPYDLINYGITASGIGLNKITLDACSTWKTCGVLTSVRKESNGKIRYAIFATAPMAASANVKSNISVQDSYTLKGNEKTKNIIINFGADAINLTNYAKESHIKEIRSNLYINGELVSSISASKKSNVRKDYILCLSRESEDKYPLNIEVKSTLYTEFSVDGLMQDGLSKKVNIVFEKYKVALENVQLRLLSKEDNKYMVSELMRTNVTDSYNSLGIIQAGNHLAIKIDTDYSKDDINLFINGKKQVVNVVCQKDKCIFLDCLIDDKIITINSWNLLRSTTNNYFCIDEDDIGKRVREPNILKIVVAGMEKVVKFDCIDKYNMNINYNFSGVKNKERVNIRSAIEKW